MSIKLTIILIVLLGLLALSSSRPSFEDDDESSDVALDEDTADAIQVARSNDENETGSSSVSLNLL